jgi:mannose-1-phosphate guanylyltransferase
MDLRGVILAGGVGTRFWPLSRQKSPKQFLPIISDRTMIEETVDRLLPAIPAANIYTIANQEQTQVMRDYIPALPEDNFLIEPQARNTAPCLVLATAIIYTQNPEAVVAVFPADHSIQKEKIFQQKLLAGAEMAARTENLITFGIPPDFPSTGYGYIRFDREAAETTEGENFFEVREFKEKPDAVTAREFLTAGHYYWNSGMFIWQARTFAQKLEECAPEYFSHWQNILEALRTEDRKAESDRIAEIYPEMPATSIDYALMEKARGVLMGEGNFGWSDVGAWSSLSSFWEKDDKGNAVRGDGLILDAENNLVYNPDKLTALVGVKDLIVVETDDALLICPKDLDQKVKEIVAELKKRLKKEYL